MKPLTIEELKALEVGDWVWVIDINELGRTKGTYREIYDIIGDEVLLCGNVYGMRRYSDYGTKWLAYKNKEQAEAKGEIVELIAPLDSELWEIECPKHKDHKGNTWTSLTYKDAKVVKSKYKLSLSNYDMLLKGYYFLSEEQPEARLQELRGEK